MNPNLHLFGTERRLKNLRIFLLGTLHLCWMETVLRNIQYKGVELIRNVSFLVLERDWGTLTPEITALELKGCLAYG